MAGWKIGIFLPNSQMFLICVKIVLVAKDARTMKIPCIAQTVIYLPCYVPKFQTWCDGLDC